MNAKESDVIGERVEDIEPADDDKRIFYVRVNNPTADKRNDGRQKCLISDRVIQSMTIAPIDSE